MIETNEKVAILSKEIGSLTKEREDIKKNQNGNCRTENTITKYKKSVCQLNRRMERIEDRISEL